MKVTLKIIKWLLLFVVGTTISTPLALVVPYGFLLTDFIVSSIKFWLHDLYPNSISVYPSQLKITSGFFAGTDSYIETTLAIIITGLYFGIVFALSCSKNRKQILAAVGLIVLYIFGTFLLIIRAAASLT